MEEDFFKQVQDGERFKFGDNWKAFLKTVNDERINEAMQSLTRMLGDHVPAGHTFLDIGCGSGLFSLAARKLGYRVLSFDFDKGSVECTRLLKKKYLPGDENWRIEESSVLNKDWLLGIGKFDVVYAWGVLHHTGQMWTAMENSAIPVREDGKLFIAIYNDQGLRSKIWLVVKRLYNSGGIGRLLMKSIFIPYFVISLFFWDLFSIKNPLKRFHEYKKLRGMSIFTDLIDWIGGYPFEVATPKKVCDFYFEKGFICNKAKTTKRLGCNEFVFIKGGLS